MRSPLPLMLCALTGLVGPIGPARAAATDLQPLESIERRAIDALRRRVVESDGVAPDATSVEVVPLDSRLRLAACTAPLVAEPLRGAGAAPWGAVTVEIACPTAPAWRVRVRARVVVEREAWVLRRSVRRDEPLEASLVVRETVRLGATDRAARRRGAAFASGAPLEDLDARIGERFVHPLPAGAALDASDLKPALLVRRGAEVRLLSESGALRIETRAVALADARRGERVAVRNERSGRRLEAVVSGPDEVVVR